MDSKINKLIEYIESLNDCDLPSFIEANNFLERYTQEQIAGMNINTLIFEFDAYKYQISEQDLYDIYSGDK